MTQLVEIITINDEILASFESLEQFRAPTEIRYESPTETIYGVFITKLYQFEDDKDMVEVFRYRATQVIAK